MNKIFVLSLLFLFAYTGCSKNQEIYDNSIADLGLGFVSKQMCSCLFVVEQSNEFCLDFVKLKQISPDIIVDKDKKTVTAKVYWFFSRSSHFIDNNKGCIVD